MKKLPSKISKSPTKEVSNFPGLEVLGRGIPFQKNGEAPGDMYEYTFDPRSSKNSAYGNEEQEERDPISKQEIYERLGFGSEELRPQEQTYFPMMIDESVKSKGKSETRDDLITNIEREIERLKYQREKHLQDKARREEERNRYTEVEEEGEAEIVLFKSPDRVQHLNHNISSLEKPTLENVEALARAHKEKLQEIERKYLEQKQKNIFNQEDRFQKDYGNIFQSPDYRQEKDLEAERLRRREEEQYDYKKKFQKYSAEKKQSEQKRKIIVEEAKQSASPNTKVPGILRQSQEKRTQGKSRSRSPVNNKADLVVNKKLVFETPKKQNKDNKTITTSPSKNKKSPQTQDTSKQTDFSEKEVLMFQFVFNNMDTNHSGSVSKQEILSYLSKNPELLKLCGFEMSELNDDIRAFHSEHAGFLRFSEFLDLLLRRNQPAEDDLANFLEIEKIVGIEEPREEVKESIFSPPIAQKSSQDVESKKASVIGNQCKLNEAVINCIKETFYKLDKYEDLVVRRQDLVKGLRENPMIRRVLHEPAVYLVDFDKNLSLESLLAQIGEEATQGKEEQRRAKEYISLTQFLKYFTNYESPQRDGISLQESPPKQSQKSPIKQSEVSKKKKAETIELSEDVIEFLKEVHMRISGHRKLAETVYLVDSIRGDERYKFCKKDLAITRSGFSSFGSETVEEVINRLEVEAERFISWEDFLAYFSEGGRPKNQLKQELVIENPEKSAMEIYMRSLQIKAEEEKSAASIFTTPKRDEKKPISVEEVDVEEVEEVELEEDSLQNEDQDMADSLEKDDNRVEQDSLEDSDLIEEERRYTVPEPFEFMRREGAKPKSIRERKFEEMIQEKKAIDEELQRYQFRAKSVPPNTTDPLYEKILNEQRERREQGKKMSVAMTKILEEPFSFYIREKCKTPKSVKQAYNFELDRQFKARPIPAMCQIDEDWREMEERKEIERRERIARAAQENLLKAALPPRMEKHEQERKQKEMRDRLNGRVNEEEEDRRNFQAGAVPDFEKMHQQFNEHLERNKKNKRTTEMKPFAFQEPKRGVVRDYLDEENQQKRVGRDEVKKDPVEVAKRVLSAKPKIQPQTTKKMVALTDQRKQEREAKQAKEEQVEKEEEERKAKYEKMKQRVRESPQLAMKADEERSRRTKEDILKKLNKDKKNFEGMQKEISENVAKRPLLIEQGVAGLKMELEEMKNLSKINKIMKAAGVKDPSVYFTREERDKIADAEFLAKKGIKEMMPDKAF